MAGRFALREPQKLEGYVCTERGLHAGGPDYGCKFSACPTPHRATSGGKGALAKPLSMLFSLPFHDTKGQSTDESTNRHGRNGGGNRAIIRIQGSPRDLNHTGG